MSTDDTLNQDLVDQCAPDDESAFVVDPSYCPACGGTGSRLGRLGGLVWFRCRYCGMDYNQADE